MKQVKINAVLSNSDNETVNIESLATYNEKENKIIYTEEDLNVAITILKNKVIIERMNEDYDLRLEFTKDEVNKCKYNVKTIGLDMEIDVYTKNLEIEDNRLYIEYELYNNNNSIGTFEYKLIFRE
ncbi:unknown [Clostridium sp. CAG:1193]|nr:unknown [Clostridium sp. CAG:1193]